MRKARTLKPKIWGSSATLHFWNAARSDRGADLGPYGNNGGGHDADLEQITHGRWHSPSDSFHWFNPTILGASPFERRDFAIKNRR
jgi:hypothetical protein